MRQVNHIPVAVLVIVFTLTMAWPGSEAWAADPAFQVPTGERQLFLDDHVVAEINNLTHTMHQPDKKGAVIRPDWHMEERCLQTRSAPCWDPEAQVFKLGVSATLAPVSTCFIWESTDGLHWSRQQKSNMKFDMMVYDGTDPDPARRYKCLLPAVAWGPARDTGGAAISPDGVTWTLLDIPPIPSYDEWNFSFDEQEHLFIGMVKVGGPYGRSWAISTSKDFEHWTESEMIFHADELDQEIASKAIERCFADPGRMHPEYNTPGHAGAPGSSRPPGGGGPPYIADIYQFPVFRYEGLYIGLPTIFHQTGTVPPDWAGFDKLNLPDSFLELVRDHGDYTGFHNVQLACSWDLHTWQRLGDRQPFIPLSPVGTGAYDTQLIMAPSNAVVRGDELWFYYTGGKLYSTAGAERKRYAICLAVLRRDGFISLDAGEEGGSIITKAMRIPEGAQRLCVNVDAPQGELRAAMRNPSTRVVVPAGQDLETGVTFGQPLEDFAIDKCVPVTGDQGRAEVTWEGNTNLSALAGQDVQIRFRLRSASFYSFWFE